MSSKLKYVEWFVIPGMKTGAQILRTKDANTTGSDDLTADIFDFAADAFFAVKNGLPLPDLPVSLRPKSEQADTDPLPDAPA